MFVCRLQARRQIHHRLNVRTVTAYLSRLACQALHRVPHGDTVAALVGRLVVEELAGVRTDLVRSLIFVQFFECRVGGKKDIKARLGSLRNLAADLLESLRTAPLPPPAELDAFLATAFQVRLDTS